MGVARAITGKPSILLADEPTGNPHSTQSKEIMALFQELNRQGTTIIKSPILKKMHIRVPDISNWKMAQ